MLDLSIFLRSVIISIMRTCICWFFRQCKGPSHAPYPCVMALQPEVEMPRLVMNR